MSRTLRSGIGLGALLLLAAAARLAYLVVDASGGPPFEHLLHDARRYDAWATALATGGPWEAGPYHQAPLYPYLVSVVYRVAGPRPATVFLLQVLGGLATLLLIHRIASRLHDARAGFVATALAALYGVLVFYDTKLLPASLAALLCALAVERLQAAERAPSRSRWLLAGAVLGLGALASAGSLVLLVLAAGWILLRGTTAGAGRIRSAGLLLAGAAIVIAPVTLRNLRVGGDLVLISTNGGITFYQGNNPAADGVYSAPEGFSGSISSQRRESLELAERETGRRMRDSEVSRFWFRKGLRFIRDNPGRCAHLLARKLGFALDSYEQPLEYNPALDRNPVRVLLPLPFAILLGLAGTRLALRTRPSRAELPVLLSIAAQALVLLAFYATSRYRLPAIPALAALAGVGAVETWDRLRTRPRTALAPLLVAALLAWVSLRLMPWTDPDHYRKVECMGLCDRAGTYASAGRFKEAVAIYREAIRRDPGYAFAHLDLARALDGAGERAGAEEELREAVRLAPSLAEARMTLGVHLYEEGRFDAASDAFAEAFRLSPSSDTGNNLIGASLQAGRAERALAAWREMKERGLPVDPPLETRLGETH